jgi:polyhydroxybutyrate depolymerase
MTRRRPTTSINAAWIMSALMILALTANGPSASATSAKAGGRCSAREVGTTVTGAGGVRLTCVRSGRATTWHRVVTTSASTPVAPPVTTSAPARATFDPYEGSRPGVTPVGRVTEAQLATPDGRTRRYRLYVPASLGSGAAVPLLVALHGGLGTSSQFAANSGFDELAEANRFVVVYPDGIGNQPDGSGFQTWNGGFCCGPAVTQQVDDVAFVGLLITTLSGQWPIDPARVHVAGHSNGGILAYRLACELGGRIAAIGVQAGSNVVDGCSPSSPVSVLHLHGAADTNMPINGGRGTGVSGATFPPARSAVDAMVRANGCAPTSAAVVAAANPDVAATTWSSCPRGVTVRFVVVSGASHAWMGHPGQSAAGAALVGEPYAALDASRLIWSFLAAHPRR